MNDLNILSCLNGLRLDDPVGQRGIGNFYKAADIGAAQVAHQPITAARVRASFHEFLPLVFSPRPFTMARITVKIVFPNSTLVASLDAVEFKQGEAVKNRAPVLEPDLPWEGVLTYVYGSVIKNRLHRMWYQANGIYVAYARSRDGVSWEKPLLSRFKIEHPHVGPTVTLTDGGGALCANATTSSPLRSNVVFDLHMPSVLYDPDDMERPYKLFGYSDRGYCAAFSKDGIHFTPAAGNPVIPLLRVAAPCGRKTWFSDVAPVFRDRRAGKFVSHVKTYALDSAGRVRRCVGYAESTDFMHWSAPKTIWVPGDYEDRLAQTKGFNWSDFYGLCGFNYGDGYLGMLWLFYIDYEIERGTHEGRIEVYLASSPDGKNWARFSDTPLIPLSEASWDSGMLTTANLPLFDKDKIRLYYGGSNMSHGAGEPGNPYNDHVHRFNIGLATLRKDGFVYAWSPKGRLRTKAMECNKGLIRINADCTQGRLVVGVNNNGSRLETFEMTGADELDRRLRTSLRGPLAFEVTIENARLYSLEVT